MWLLEPIQELSNIYVHLAGLTFINKFWKRCVINKFMNHAVGVEIINQNDKRERAINRDPCGIDPDNCT